ncbi:MAG: VWA domain-containing protein [Clostridiaceae bacterium]
MKKLLKGEKLKISEFISEQEIEIIVSVNSSMTIDITCFGLDKKKQLFDDRYLIFYDQTSFPENSVQMSENNNGTARFKVQLSKIPDTVRDLVFIASIYGKGDMSKISGGFISICDKNGEQLRYEFDGSDFNNERAIILAEIYFKDLWRVNITGTGFEGGLSALVKQFGGKEEEEEITSQQQIETDDSQVQELSSKKMRLEKKMEQKAPGILSLAKKADVSLKKAGLENHNAKIALCLDISGSMNSLYTSGKMQEFAEKMLALGCRFDNGGSIDLFLFGQKLHEAGEMTIENFDGYINKALEEHPLEGGTYYGKVIEFLRDFYAKGKKPKVPAYVIFVTDGTTFDKDFTRDQLIQASNEPIFWQFMAIGSTRNEISPRRRGFYVQLTEGDFTFLEQLDKMEGRYTDNTNFFSVEDPSLVPDDELYDLLLGEYPKWLKEAKEKSVLK